MCEICVKTTKYVKFMYNKCKTCVKGRKNVKFVQISCKKLLKFVLNMFNTCKSDVYIVYIFSKLIPFLGHDVYN